MPSDSCHGEPKCIARNCRVQLVDDFGYFSEKNRDAMLNISQHFRGLFLLSTTMLCTLEGLSNKGDEKKWLTEGRCSVIFSTFNLKVPVVLFWAHERKVVRFVLQGADRGCICCDIMVMCGMSYEKRVS